MRKYLVGMELIAHSKLFRGVCSKKDFVKITVGTKFTLIKKQTQKPQGGEFSNSLEVPGMLEMF